MSWEAVICWIMALILTLLGANVGYFSPNELSVLGLVMIVFSVYVTYDTWERK